MWEAVANALARSIFPIGAVRGAGVCIEAHGAFTNGVGVLLALTAAHHAAPSVYHAEAGLACAQAAAGALANTLAHAPLRHLWTTSPDTLGYLLKLDESQVERIRALPEKLRLTPGARS